MTKEMYSEIKASNDESYKGLKDIARATMKLSKHRPKSYGGNFSIVDFISSTLMHYVISDLFAPFEIQRKKLQTGGFKDIAKQLVVFGAETASPIVGFCNATWNVLSGLNTGNRKKNTYDIINEELFALELIKEKLLTTAYIAILGRLSSYATMRKAGIIEKISISTLVTQKFREYIVSVNTTSTNES